MISVSDEHTLLPTVGAPIPATTDAETTALTLALRYKMQTESSWKPYLSFGIALINTKFTHHQPNPEQYYETPFEQSGSGMRLGLGVDVGMSDHWSAGLEGSLLTNVPYYEEPFFGQMRSLDKYGVMTQLNLGLRYHFY
jgi:opacity protein-like surface antigen